MKLVAQPVREEAGATIIAEDGAPVNMIGAVSPAARETWRMIPVRIR